MDSYKKIVMDLVNWEIFEGVQYDPSVNATIQRCRLCDFYSEMEMHHSSCPAGRAEKLVNEPDEITTEALKRLGFKREYSSGDYILVLKDADGYNFELRAFLHNSKGWQLVIGDSDFSPPINNLLDLYHLLESLGVSNDQ